MTKCKITILILSLSFMARSYSFDFHYKNLNSIMASLCHSLKENSLGTNQVRLNKFSIEKNTLDQNGLKTEFTITGACNQVVNLKSKNIDEYGQEVFLNFTYNKNLKAQSFSGSLGIHPISIEIKNGKPYSFRITKSFEGSSKVFNLEKSQWAINDSLFSIGKKSGIKLKVKSRVIASETEQTLHFSATNKHYDLWNYNSYGCEAVKMIDQATCEALTLIP